MALLSSEQRALEAFIALDPLSMTRELSRLRSDPKVSGPLIIACAAAYRGLEMHDDATAPVITLRRMQREVAAPRKGKPGYRWAPGYIVVRPDGAEEYPPVDFNEARTRVRELGGESATWRIASAVAAGPCCAHTRVRGAIMKAATPPIFTPDVPGPWGVDTIGNVWCVIHKETLRAKQIGRVRARGTNYFDRAIAEANARNTTRAPEVQHKPTWEERARRAEALLDALAAECTGLNPEFTEVFNRITDTDPPEDSDEFDTYHARDCLGDDAARVAEAEHDATRAPEVQP